MSDNSPSSWQSRNLLTTITVSTDQIWLNKLIQSRTIKPSHFPHLIKMFSNDESERITFLEECNITIIESRDNGIYDALNQALKHIKSPYYLVLGDDDILDEFFLSTIISKYQPILENLQPSLLRFRALNESTKKIGCYHSVSHIIKTELHIKYGLYSTLFKIASDQLFLNLIAREQIFESDEVIGLYGGAGVSAKGLRLHLEHNLSLLLGYLKK